MKRTSSMSFLNKGKDKDEALNKVVVSFVTNSG